MCSLELYNWYESKYPQDFSQLVKIKHYNISDVSFSLSHIWDRLNHAEKLLMCAVHYDDLSLAKQVLNEKQSKVNPFKGKHFATQNSDDSSSGFSGQLAENSTDFSNVFIEEAAESPRKPKYRRFSLNRSEATCQCLENLSPPTPSFLLEFKYEQIRNLKLTNTVAVSHDLVSEQLSCDLVCPQTPFYLAIRLKRLNICKLFLNHLKTLDLMKKSRRIIVPRNCPHRHLSVSTSSNTARTVYLNSTLSNEELIRLLCVALSDRSFDIAMLILDNVFNPKRILCFQSMSESFIYQPQFCHKLTLKGIVHTSVLIKEAISRHATETTYYLIDQLELSNESSDFRRLCKNLLATAVLVGDVNIFKMLLLKISQHGQLVSEMTIHALITSNYHHVLEKFKLTSSNLNLADAVEVRKNAKGKVIDVEAYFDCQETIESQTNNQLTHLNRLKALQFLLFDESGPVVEIEQKMSQIWIAEEASKKATIASFDKIFAAEEYSEKDEPTNKQVIEKKRFCLGRYLVYAESEPFLVEHLLSHLKPTYEISCLDLTQAAQSDVSELTLYNLLKNIDDFNCPSKCGLLEPLDEVQGNFLEILFCRMVRCRNGEQERRLRFLFFEAVVLKNAKMTCSTNLLDVFASNNQEVQTRLLHVYFPCLYFMQNALLSFQSSVHAGRFKLLADWFVRKRIEAPNRHLEALNEQQLEVLVIEFYEGNANMSIDLSLKKLARQSFMSLCRSSELGFVNRISEAARQFLFYLSEIKQLLQMDTF